MARVTPEDRLSCNQLVKFMQARPALSKNFRIDHPLFFEHLQTVKSIRKRLGSKINSLEDDLKI